MLARLMVNAQAMARAVCRGDPAYFEGNVERGRKLRQSLIERQQV
jgi:hypothetical protein